MFVDEVDIGGCNHGFCKIHPRLRFACGRSCCMCIAFVWGMCVACGLQVVGFFRQEVQSRVFGALLLRWFAQLVEVQIFNSIQSKIAQLPRCACVCVAVGFQGLAFGMVHARHVDVAHPLPALQWIEVNPIEKVIQMMSQNWRRSLVRRRPLTRL